MHQRSPDQSSHRSALLYRLKNYILTPSARPELSDAARGSGYRILAALCP